MYTLSYDQEGQRMYVTLSEDVAKFLEEESETKSLSEISPSAHHFAVFFIHVGILEKIFDNQLCSIIFWK